MKFLRYFFYIAKNWNLSIAFHIIKNEMRGEKKYGIESTATDELHELEELGIDTQHATMYMPVSYDVLEHCFLKVDIQNSNHFLDIGCGMGRAMAVASTFGAEKITGIDFSKSLIVKTKENILQAKQKHPTTAFKAILQDAYYYDIPLDVDVIFMFNPFDDFVLEKVLQNIDESITEDKRTVTIIYVNPVHKHLLPTYGYKEKYYFKHRKYLEGAIYEK